MDISGVMIPASSHASRQKSGDAAGVAVEDRAVESEAQSVDEMISSVVHNSQEIPGEKLASHLGRNIDVTV